MESVNECWRVYKSRVKMKHFYKTPVELRWSNRPSRIPDDQFKNLLEYWDNPEVEEQSRINRNNRQKLQDIHTMGPKPYQLLRNQLQQNDPNKAEPTQHMVYKASRARDPNKLYKTDELKAKENIERMDALQSLVREENSFDPYYEVIDKTEHHGRVRLYGKTMKNSSLSKKGNTSFILPEEYMENMQAMWYKDLMKANPQLAGEDLVIPQFQKIPNFDHIEKNGGESLVQSEKLSNEVHDQSDRDDDHVPFE